MTATFSPAADAPRRVLLLDELRALLKLALPLSVAQGGQALMGLVDSAVVGRVSPAALAGAGLGNGLFFAVSILGVGVVMGADALVSQAVGAKDTEGARHWMWQSVWVAVATGTVLSGPVALLPWALHHTRVPDEVVREASRFLYCRIPGLIPFLLFFAQRAYLQAVGRAGSLVAVMALANVLNFALDVLLVYGGASLPHVWWPLSHVPALGVAGAALSTDLCSLFVLAFLGARMPREIPRPPRRAPRPKELMAVLRVGLPVGLHFFLESGIFTVAGLLAARMGSVSGAAHQIALSFASVSFTVAVGIGAAGAVRVGYAVGAGDRVRARRSGLIAFGAGAGFMFLSATAFASFPGPIARLMTGDPAVLAVAVPLLFPAAVFQVSDGAQAVGAGVLRGAGDTAFAFWANLFGHYGVGLPLTLVLGLLLGRGVVGLWWGLCAGLTMVGLLLLARFERLSRRDISRLV